MDWCGSSSREPALHMQSPEFKPQSHQKQYKQKGWGHGSSGRALASYVQGPGFNLQYEQGKKAELSYSAEC
jgi:hypothetical protein